MGMPPEARQKAKTEQSRVHCWREFWGFCFAHDILTQATRRTEPPERKMNRIKRKLERSSAASPASAGEAGWKP
jgi:hypothetical protein